MSSEKSQNQVHYEITNKVLTLKRRKRKPVRFEELPAVTKKNSFRTIATAMKFGCAMRNIGEKYMLDPDLEINDAYEGILTHFAGHAIERFRKLVKMICQMIRVINMFRQHARDTGRPVHVDTLSRDKRFNSSIPAHPLSFDPKLYSPKEFQYRMEPEARKILQSPWMSRTKEQLRQVWISLRHLKQFRNMTAAMQMIMARYARYEMHGKNRTIVRKGDPGRHYYFIYSGQVELRNSNTFDGEEKNLPKLGTGQDFGHVALLHMQRRTATVVCTEETEFVVLDRRGNGRAVYRALLAEHKQKCNFLKTLEIFQGLDEESYRNLTDHGRIGEYLPMSLVATMQQGHPFIYTIVQGVANVALTTDVYSCSIQNNDQREVLRRLDKQRNKCNHKSDKLHDVFTRHDPKLSLVIQHLKERHVFGMQHMLHTESELPTLHLIAKSKLTVLSLPVSSVQFFAKPTALHIAREKYPIYPSVVELIRRYMEDAVWDLYKAHVIRELKHFEGRVDPSKKCKYCLSCQLRTLMVPSILPDPVRDEVTNLYCPGNTSPLPHLANQTFRPRSAPPLVTPRPSNKPNFRSLNNSPAAGSPDSRLNGDVYPLFRSSWAAKNPASRPRTAAGNSTVGQERVDSFCDVGSKRNLTRSKTAVARSSYRPSSKIDRDGLKGEGSVCKNVSFASQRASSSKMSKIIPKTSERSILT